MFIHSWRAVSLLHYLSPLAVTPLSSTNSRCLHRAKTFSWIHCFHVTNNTVIWQSEAVFLRGLGLKKSKLFQMLPPQVVYCVSWQSQRKCGELETILHNHPCPSLKGLWAKTFTKIKTITSLPVSLHTWGRFKYTIHQNEHHPLTWWIILVSQFSTSSYVTGEVPSLSAESYIDCSFKAKRQVYTATKVTTTYLQPTVPPTPPPPQPPCLLTTHALILKRVSTNFQAGLIWCPDSCLTFISCLVTISRKLKWAVMDIQCWNLFRNWNLYGPFLWI